MSEKPFPFVAHYITENGASAVLPLADQPESETQALEWALLGSSKLAFENNRTAYRLRFFETLIPGSPHWAGNKAPRYYLADGVTSLNICVQRNVWTTLKSMGFDTTTRYIRNKEASDFLPLAQASLELLESKGIVQRADYFEILKETDLLPDNCAHKGSEPPSVACDILKLASYIIYVAQKAQNTNPSELLMAFGKSISPHYFMQEIPENSVVIDRATRAVIAERPQDKTPYKINRSLHQPPPKNYNF